MTEPSRRCHLHMRQATIFPCGACEDAMTRWRDWKAEEDHKKSEFIKSVAAARARTIKACTLCDDTGYVKGGLCRHDPFDAVRAHRGAALARQALDKNN